jgi:hypothetical protein
MMERKVWPSREGRGTNTPPTRICPSPVEAQLGKATQVTPELLHFDGRETQHGLRQ